MKGKQETSRLAVQGIALEQGMYEKRSRYLILFLTLNYKIEYREDVTIDELCKHRDRLIRNIECNSLLSGIKAYIWKLEEGQEAGLHIHLLVFYSGTHREDISIARRIGEYWTNNATRGIGAYWNSNADKVRYKRRGWALGVGRIDRRDEEGREGIRSIIRYMGKSDQEMESRPKNRRTFGMTELI
ncbi:inovirus Gp2 family protein [Herbaspirillum sp. VT-16-41]|uniref:inovirus Gp2 family protein n=1 Tax=Herbaspirillum sp. VT-16-41 TaxID=1953765 RepID=UPI0009D55BB8|nr:inovirus Gp2 family protein [Herbaspirillum sp. VT-16-41]ONN67927.1 hypothetical protein BTM36_03815 [Herbaspirillum sp. VT-16-41]